MFEKLLGNETAKAYLRKALEKRSLPHALLFAGTDGVGKSLFAKELAAALLESTPSRIEGGNHPDFHAVRPEGKSGLHSIETFRTLIDDVHAASFEGRGKVFLIHDAERMQPAAGSALLKTLEEPNAGATLILITHAPSEILSTILSRCIRVSFQPLSEGEIALLLREKGHPERLAKLAQGSAGRAFDLAARPALEERLFPLLAQRAFYPHLAAALEEIEEEIEDEDPVRKNRNAEHLFSTIFMWHRDQQARALGVAPDRLFFPDSPPVDFPLPSLESLQKRLDESRLAFHRNIKLSVCLERLLN